MAKFSDVGCVGAVKGSLRLIEMLGRGPGLWQRAKSKSSKRWAVYTASGILGF